MKKIFIALLIALTALSCSQRDNRIVKRISKQIYARDKTLDLSTAAPFEWDAVFFFQPYSAQSTIEQALGCPWPDYEKSGIGHNEAFSLILFMNRGEIVAWCMNPRNNGDFATVYSTQGYTKADVFQIEYTGASKRANVTKK
jgi:hypothetical protein